VVDERTIRVIPNTAAARKELEPLETRTFVPPDTSKDGVVGLADIKVEDETKIVVTDTVDNPHWSLRSSKSSTSRVSHC
jgi:hypothetical protein